MTTMIDETRLSRFLAPDIHLRAGKGSGANGTVDVCVMQAVHWLAGGDGKTDSPPCASRLITRYATRLNDSDLFAEHRDLLKPYAPRIVGTRTTDADEFERAFICADYAVRVFAPLWLRELGREQWAKDLEAVPPVTDKASSIVARAAARKVRDATYAAYAAYAASAASAADATYAASAASAASAADAAYAASAADAAYAASAAYAAYAASAADAAYAAYAADAASAARKRVFADRGDDLRGLALELLDKIIEVGKVAA